MDLKDLGIDISNIYEDIKDEIISKVSDAVTASILKQARTDLLRGINETLALKISSLVEETLGEIYQPLDEFGERKGGKTTIRDVFKKSCQTWWEQTVDKDGKPVSSWNGQKRYEWVASKVVNQIFRDTLEKDLCEIAKESKIQAVTAVKEKVNEIIDYIWKK